MSSYSMSSDALDIILLHSDMRGPMCALALNVKRPESRRLFGFNWRFLPENFGPRASPNLLRACCAATQSQPAQRLRH